MFFFVADMIYHHTMTVFLLLSLFRLCACLLVDKCVFSALSKCISFKKYAVGIVLNIKAYIVTVRYWNHVAVTNVFL